MNVKYPSPSTRLCRHSELFCTNDNVSRVTSILVVEILAALKSVVFDLSSTAPMDGAPFCIISFNKNRWTAQCKQMKNIGRFIRMQNKSFQYQYTDKRVEVNNVVNIITSVRTVQMDERSVNYHWLHIEVLHP